ncbi:hypothetical protein XH87_11595 [Bradyrhizobium sp. CCBAU 53415]|nr:hypothetical protein [Bradyrhizobium sp. CCBAU 53415]
MPNNPRGVDGQEADRLVSGRPSIPERVRHRPHPDQWGESEMMTLPEAAALFFPGVLTTTSLRTAVRDQRLDVVEIAGKILTNRLAVERMCVCGPRNKPGQPPPAAAPRPSDRELLRRILRSD